jgi:hypothetical protein
MAQTPAPSRFESRIRRSTRRIALWTGAWLLALALLAFGPRFLWTGQLGFTLVAAAVNLATGIGVVLAMLHHLRDLDDLHRKVLLEAMGIALGVAVFVSLPYTLLEGHDAAPFDADSAHLVVLMSLTFMASVIAGLRRYR